MSSPTATPLQLQPIGFVRGGRTAPDDDDWGSSSARIELDPARFTADALLGLDAFSHAEIVFVFDQVLPHQISFDARHPRGNHEWPKVGIFAQRGKNRPNRIGVSICHIVAVQGLTLKVRGLDAIDSTPVLDIKPVLTGFLPRGPIEEPDWAREIMVSYW